MKRPFETKANTSEFMSETSLELITLKQKNQELLERIKQLEAEQTSQTTSQPFKDSCNERQENLLNLNIHEEERLKNFREKLDIVVKENSRLLGLIQEKDKEIVKLTINSENYSQRISFLEKSFKTKIEEQIKENEHLQWRIDGFLDAINQLEVQNQLINNKNNSDTFDNRQSSLSGNGNPSINGHTLFNSNFSKMSKHIRKVIHQSESDSQDDRLKNKTEISTGKKEFLSEKHTPEHSHFTRSKKIKTNDGTPSGIYIQNNEIHIPKEQNLNPNGQDIESAANALIELSDGSKKETQGNSFL